MFKESHWRRLRSAPPETHCRGHSVPPKPKACALGPLSLFQREEEVAARPVDDPPLHSLVGTLGTQGAGGAGRHSVDPTPRPQNSGPVCGARGSGPGGSGPAP